MILTDTRRAFVFLPTEKINKTRIIKNIPWQYTKFIRLFSNDARKDIYNEFIYNVYVLFKIYSTTVTIFNKKLIIKYVYLNTKSAFENDL